MRKHLLLLSLVALAAQPLLARSLSPEEALNRAFGQHRKVAASRSIGARSSVISEPAMTIENEGTPSVYIFNKAEEGFVIVSADEVAAPILGYSDTGVLDVENLPDNLKGWLENCSRQIRRASAAGAESYSVTRETDHDPIEPLVKTKWDQTKPFNNDCPTRDGFRCVTGCVATAMAQVMKYFNWPTQVASDANISYKWRSKSIPNPENPTEMIQETLTADFSNEEFDWDNMRDSYSGNNYTETEASAVAALMKACGYSVDMDYNLASSGSAAVNNLVGKALAQYFKYDQGLHNEPREVYSAEQWEELIYNNLHDCGPIVYWGGIHCFVCDGYQSDGYFHFNWGWSGEGDGWFLLDALNPTTVGTGGNFAGYNNDQGALLGIKPAGDVPSERHYTFYTLGLSEVKAGPGTTLTLRGRFKNYSSYVVEPVWAFRVYSEDGTEYIGTTDPPCYIPSQGSTFELDVDKTRIEGGVSSSVAKANTTYRIYPALIIDGKEYEFLCPPSMPSYALYKRSEVDGVKNYWAELPDVGKKEILDLSSNGNIYVGQPRIKISGIGKFTGDASASMSVTWRLLNTDGSEACLGNNFTVQFTPEGKPFEAVCQWLNSYTLQPGDYLLALSYKDDIVDTNNYFNLATCPVTLCASANPSYKATSFTVENPSAVDPDNIKLSVAITAESGYAYEDIRFDLFDSEMKSISEQKAPLYVTAPGSTNVAITTSIPNATSGGTYYAKVLHQKNNTWVDLTDAVPFTIKKNGTTGISDITADDRTIATAYPNPATDFTLISAPTEITQVTLHSLSGQQTTLTAEIDGCTARLDLSALAKGIYIATITMTDGHSTVKIIKK